MHNIHRPDWLMIFPVVISAFIMLVWCYAYFVFPAALKKTLKRLDAGPFEGHITGVHNFVIWCAHSHWIMFAHMLLMLAVMYASFRGLYELAVGFFWVANVPLIFGALYSLRQAKSLLADADNINRFILQAQKLLAAHKDE